MILVSACLLGKNCRYDGGHNLRPLLEKHIGDKLIPICPEVMGGLPTPRYPVELMDSGGSEIKAVNSQGKDVTAEFLAGARKACQLASETGAKIAILKERSPSCGCKMVYDGSFSRRLIPGQGIAAKMLATAGVQILSDEDLTDELLERLLNNH